MDEAQDEIRKLAEALRADKALGRSPVLNKLFDFLAARSGDAASPKEVEIAAEVFGRDAGFDVGQDASVRVYMHRLRRKLDDYYVGRGAAEDGRLTIPKGEYRIVLRSSGEEASAPRAVGALSLRDYRVWAAALAAVVLVNVLIWGGVTWWRSSQDTFAYARSSPAWTALFGNDRPVTVVVGDYYIFAETDGVSGVDRLVREFDINSPKDLADHLAMNPELMGRYEDVDLHYLPVASAFALNQLAPLLSSGPRGGQRVRTVLASDLTPDMLKQSNIIYIGYLSALGILRGPVFAGSRFKIGESYDELIDQTTRRRYTSEEGLSGQGQTRRDFGYFSSFAGPEGNRIMVIAGTRDIAVMQMAEAAVGRATLGAMTRMAGPGNSFEALYEVEGIGRINLGGRLIAASPLDVTRIWSADPAALSFPAG
jgi:hypothetical protein